MLTSFCGCQQSPPPRAFRVKGRLFVDDQLAAKACIAFHPIDKVKSQGRCPVAMTQRDGSFELTTYAMHDGAPEGDYTVTVTWPDDSMPVDECECVDPLLHDRLSGKYADPQKTSLLVTILPQDNQINLCAQGVKRNGRPGLDLPWNTVEGDQ